MEFSHIKSCRQTTTQMDKRINKNKQTNEQTGKNICFKQTKLQVNKETKQQKTTKQKIKKYKLYKLTQDQIN